MKEDHKVRLFDTKNPDRLRSIRYYAKEKFKR